MRKERRRKIRKKEKEETKKTPGLAILKPKEERREAVSGFAPEEERREVGCGWWSAPEVERREAVGLQHCALWVCGCRPTAGLCLAGLGLASLAWVWPATGSDDIF
jgi:hypothetical protein